MQAILKLDNAADGSGRFGRFTPVNDFDGTCRGFPKQFGELFGFEGLTGSVIVKGETKALVAADWLRDEGYEVKVESI